MKNFLLAFCCILFLNLLLTSKTYAFSPSDITGITAWYKPESLQLNNNDPVSNWLDSSGNGYTLQQTTSLQRPYFYSAYGINGLPTVRFQGGQELKMNGNLCSSLSNEATLFVVARMLNDETYNLVDTNPSSDTWWRFEDTTGYMGVFRPDRVERIAVTPNSGSHIFALKSGTNYSFYIDRIHQNTVAGNFSCGDIFAIGGVSGNKMLIGDISEVIVYNSTLSDTDRASVEDYLYTKYFTPEPSSTPTPTPVQTPSSFLPTDVSGLTAWYKPESLQLNNNDPVSSWTDSSGNGFTLQQLSSSAQPAYTTSGINGLPTVRFNEDELKVATNLCSMLIDQSTLFVVSRINNDSTYNLVDTNPETDSYWRDGVFGVSYLGVFRKNRVARFINFMPTSGSHIFTLKSGTQYSFYTDRAHNNTVDGNFSCGEMFGIGGVSGGKPFIGDISEVVVYNSVLSNINRMNVENYLYRKYFITPPSVNTIPNISIIEGDIYTHTGSFVDSDSTSWTATVDYGDGAGVQPLTLSGINFSLNHVYKDNGTYTVTVSVTGNQGATGTATATITVNNVAPSVGMITASINPVQINTSTTASATFTDLGVLDTHTASWNWGDGNTTTGTVTESNGSGSVSNTHSYAAAGVYTITLTVTDNNNASSSSVFQYLTVYDPAAGWVTGGKEYTSPVGAVTGDSGATGKADFGFTARYDVNGNLIPLGGKWASLTFQSGATNINFNATAYLSLVVTGSKVIFSGTGTLNGISGYSLLISSIEGTTSDFVRYQIKDSSGSIVYDTQQGASDTTDPTTVVTKGKIDVH